MKRFALTDLPTKYHASIIAQCAPRKALTIPKTLDKDNLMELWEKYQELGSVHKVGAALGINGQTVKNRLNAAGYRLNGSRWTEQEKAAVADYYQNTPDAEFSIKRLAESLNRTFAAVAIKADRWGFAGKRTDSTAFSDSHRASISKAQIERVKRIGVDTLMGPLRKYMTEGGNGFAGHAHTEETKLATSKRFKAWHAKNPHPKGMLGKTHTKEVRDAISKAQTGRIRPRAQVEAMLRTAVANGTLYRNKPHGSWKAAWVEVGGKRFYARSKWEANYARYLEWLKQAGQISDWQHEPKTFWFEGVKRGCVSYLPDFCVTMIGGAEEYHEVKGWMDARSITKIKRMAKYHPEVTLNVIDSKRYRILAKQLKNIVPGWES